MSESIPLLPPPAPGWQWSIEEVNLSGQVFYAAIQQRQPEPPRWWEEMYENPTYSHALTALTFVIVGGKKIYTAWKGRNT